MSKFKGGRFGMNAENRRSGAAAIVRQIADAEISNDQDLNTQERGKRNGPGTLQAHKHFNPVLVNKRGHLSEVGVAVLRSCMYFSI